MKKNLLFVVLVLLMSSCASSQQQSSSQAATSLSSGQTTAAVTSQAGASSTAAAPVKSEPVAQPAAVAAPNQKDEGIVKATIETTMGTIGVELFAKEAPKTVDNFVKLASKGFYDGIIFHRVIPDFMIQTGDPTGTGMGGPGYQFADEFGVGLKHNKPGILSMANSGPDTNGSQFFITVAPTPWLDGKHAIFGQVTSGMDVATQISMVNRDGNDKPIKPIKMIKVTIVK